MPNRCTRTPPTTPATRWPLLFGLLLVVALGSGCRREPAPIEGAPAEPVEAVQALAGALREGDLVRYARLSVPPAMYAEQQQLWRQSLLSAAPVDPVEAERWRGLMAALTAPDAEAALWARVEPRLQDLEQQVGPSWEVAVGMMPGFAAAAIAAHPALSEAEKAHARSLVEAVSAWAGDQARLTDPARAQAAIAVAVRTARALQLPELEGLRKLELEAALTKGSVALEGFKALAAAYGIDLDAALAQVEAEVIALEGDHATLRVRYPLLGQVVEFEQPMVRIDGGWYRAEAVESHRRAMAAEAEAAAEAQGEAAAAAPAAATP